MEHECLVAQALESLFNTGKPSSRPLQSFFLMTYLQNISNLYPEILGECPQRSFYVIHGVNLLHLLEALLED